MFGTSRVSWINTGARAAACLLLAATATGCMTAGESRRLDAKFEAGWRPSKGYCTFGGETPLLDAYCARVNFGAEGAVAILRDINDEVLAQAGGSLRCTDHVARAQARLKPYAAEFRTEELYSCDRDPPVVDGKPVCHVSLLVTDTMTGARFVVDNGHVLKPATSGGVGRYAEFASLVDRAWTGETRHWVALSGN
jgi:hypothetical protein